MNINFKSRKELKNCVMFSTELKSMDFFIFFATNPMSDTVCITGLRLMAIPISIGVA